LRRKFEDDKQRIATLRDAFTSIIEAKCKLQSFVLQFLIVHSHSSINYKKEKDKNIVFRNFFFFTNGLATFIWNYYQNLAENGGIIKPIDHSTVGLFTACFSITNY
jgi:hypothetical protein